MKKKLEQLCEAIIKAQAELDYPVEELLLETDWRETVGNGGHLRGLKVVWLCEGARVMLRADERFGFKTTPVSVAAVHTETFLAFLREHAVLCYGGGVGCQSVDYVAFKDTKCDEFRRLKETLLTERGEELVIGQFRLYYNSGHFRVTVDRDNPPKSIGGPLGSLAYQFHLASGIPFSYAPLGERLKKEMKIAETTRGWFDAIEDAVNKNNNPHNDE